MQAWYKTVVPRKEVREGRSFNPDEFAIALEQVVAKTAPLDYRDPVQFFSRTCFTRALSEHAGMVLRRLDGRTENTAPVLTLITQFGGGKTHTLTALYHLVNGGQKASAYPGIGELLRQSGVPAVPDARVAVFVGNAWDPQEGRENPWIDVARQLAGSEGVAALGPAALESPPGTEAIARLFDLAGGRVLLLFDEVLNFINRHRGFADSFHAFVQNLTVATTGATGATAVISLPRSQVEMTDWDLVWQERITKVVRRVAKDLIANDEAEIGEVVRRRLFEDLGTERVWKVVARTYADWCFERRAQLPPEWTAVDAATTEKKAREYLQARFEACYPFHPATLSVFQRKWQALSQYQQTRGTLAMLAQWISWAYRDGFTHARSEPTITLGSAPLHVPEFLGVVLGQLGESRLLTAIESDIAGAQAHARVLDADTAGPLRDIHRRVGTAILFESSGGQVDKVAHLPELRFALGEPDVDTTSVDNAALALETKAYYIRRTGSDGFLIHHQPTLKKVVNDRRASLDEETEIRPTMRGLVRKEFERGASVRVSPCPEDGAVEDSPKLTIVFLDPEAEWSDDGPLRQQIVEWTKRKGKPDRLYPAALVWCVRKPGRDLRDAVEMLLAWRRVQKDIQEGILGPEVDRGEKVQVQSKASDAEDAAKDAVWASYRFVLIADRSEPDGLRLIDLGAGHASSAETLCGRVIAALKSNGLLNESVGAGYIDRHWPPALKESGAWPVSGLRQSFLDGSLTRLLDPDTVLKAKIVEFVAGSAFGLASGRHPDGTYDHLWFGELLPADEVSFEADVYLLKADKARSLKARGTPPEPPTPPGPEPEPPGGAPGGGPEPPPPPRLTATTVHVAGTIPSEVWNRLGMKLLPKLRAGDTAVRVEIDLSTSIRTEIATGVTADIRQILDELGLRESVKVEVTGEMEWHKDVDKG